MELHQLRYVLAVAQSGNFSRAAELCRVAQPSLSQQVLKLEDELGERIFDRLKRQARATPFGEIFLRRAARILEEVQAAHRDAGAAHELTTGSVSLGVLPTIAPYLLPPAAALFRARYPGLSLEVHEGTTAHLLKLAQAAEIDFAMASLPLAPGARERFTIRELHTEKLLLALPPRHPLCRKPALSLADIRREQFIVLAEGHCLGDQVLSFCEQRALRGGIAFRSAQLETIQALVAAGLGLSLIPAMAIPARRRGMPVYRELPAPQPTRKIIAAWPRQRPPSRAAEALLEILHGIAASSGVRQARL